MKKFVVICLLCLSCSLFSGCNIKSRDPKNVEDWIVPDNARFVPIDIYNIDNTSFNGVDFITYVDLKNGTMWLHTSSFRNGYGTTFVKLTDENNNACIYEDLENLRDKYNYKED